MIRIALSTRVQLFFFFFFFGGLFCCVLHSTERVPDNGDDPRKLKLSKGVGKATLPADAGKIRRLCLKGGVGECPGRELPSCRAREAEAPPLPGNGIR